MQQSLAAQTVTAVLPKVRPHFVQTPGRLRTHNVEGGANQATPPPWLCGSIVDPGNIRLTARLSCLAMFAPPRLPPTAAAVASMFAAPWRDFARPCTRAM